MNTCDLLKQIPLFSELEDDEIVKLSGIVGQSSYTKGEVIVNEGDVSSDLYIVITGKVVVFTYKHNDQKLILNTFSSGEHFGELSFLDTKPRSGTVQATEDTEVLIVPRQPFMHLFPNGSKMAMSLATEIGLRLRFLTDQLDALFLLLSQQELQEANLDTICRLVNAAEYSDKDTGAHLSRMSEYSRFVADKLDLQSDVVQYIGEAAPLHDIGKIGIPQYILQKPGKLTLEEFAIMQTHTEIGAKILSNPKSELIEYAHQIALYHHEKFDGTGYPTGLSGINIPVAARIVTLVDAFDALTVERPYKKALPTKKALGILKRDRGTHFDPVIFDIFEIHFDGILYIYKDYS